MKQIIRLSIAILLLFFASVGVAENDFNKLSKEDQEQCMLMNGLVREYREIYGTEKSTGLINKKAPIVYLKICNMTLKKNDSLDTYIGTEFGCSIYNKIIIVKDLNNKILGASTISRDVHGNYPHVTKKGYFVRTSDYYAQYNLQYEFPEDLKIYYMNYYMNKKTTFGLLVDKWKGQSYIKLNYCKVEEYKLD